jgi:hypothetical protein
MNDLIVVEEIAGWEKLKALVLDSVSSPITKRVYNMALNEFLWLRTVSYRFILEIADRRVSSDHI